ncbi:Uncharacterised protein [Mycoplasmopsis maculosa]|uniref:Uncharacterized protein n=1 Tax=Mycoplasmopsis maculosa TaxID=114885 RepID=A0A449B4Z6_9BACT|nr:PDxFFG protein [Mycoplasmopsis maculosa]VEU75645.1 Uncharacterised protein [Mycoplasmopsis maculosa]
MSRKKINLKTLVWPKYAISAVLLSAITAATLGTMYFYSKNSDDNLGKENPTKRDDLVNEFIDRSTPPKTYFIEAQNQATKEQYDPKTDTVILSDGSVVSTVDYLDAYYKKHHAMPYLKISYGSFNFFNQYIEAVSPIEFFKFTEWFMNNVSWGPEIITLKSFSIVKGVEMNGNNITLGSHSNRNKEYTTIKFFPDAFFGTLPIYSELDGRGNAQDSLTYKLNRKILTAKEVQTFLGNISRYNSLSNLSTNTVNSNFFRDIINIQDLKGLKLFAIKNENWFKEIKDISINQTEKSRLFFNNPYLLLIDGKNEAEARQKLIEKFEEYKKHDVYKVLENINPNTVALEEKIITDAKIQDNQATPTDIISDGYLNITFNDNTNMRIFKSFQDVQSRDKNSASTELTFRNNYFQIDEALVKAKEDLDELESKYQDYIRSKISTNNFGEDEILSLKNKADEYIETVRNLARIEQRLTPMEQDYTAQGTLVIQVEQEEKEISELQKSNEKLDAEIKQLEQEIDSESNETEKAKKQQQLTEKRNQVNDNNTNINAKQERIRQLRPRILSEQALQNLKNEIDNLKNQLNNLLESSNEIAKIYNDISILRRPSEYIEFSELIRGYSDIYSNSTFKMIKENKIDDSTDLQKIETLKIFFNELFKFNNIYNRITYPYENNGAAYTTPSYVENEFYKVDIAFLPNTLITMDSLVKSSEKAQLNWRDFYNLKGFLNDRKNIVGENNQDVFIYVDKSKVSELGINKGKLEFNYKELNNKLDEVNLKITNTQEKINNIQNLISNTNNSNSIASLMTSFYRQNSILPFNFRPIGNSNTDDIISNEQVFTVLLGDNATGLPAYLNVLKNGNSSSNDEFHKVGTNGLLELIRNKVPEDQRSLFDLLVENTNKRLELDSVVSTNFDVEKINEYLTALVTLNEKSLEWENLNKSKSWYFDYSQLNTAITLIKNVDRSLEIINENNINENEIISLQENLNNLILESNFYRYQIKKLSELPTFDNEEINEAYNKIVKEFNDKKE